MLDPIVNFFTRIFQWIGRGIGLVVGILLWPFVWAGRWYRQRGWILKVVVGAVLLLIIGLYANFIYATQWWSGFNPDYVNPSSLPVTRTVAGDAAAGGSPAADGAAQPEPAAPAPAACNPSAIAETTAALIDFNVNRNAWISSMLVSKLGFFGIPWRNTPFFDNKAAFQLGINQVLRRTTTELVDTLGRVRGTSQIDQNLQDARTALAWDETAWYIGLRGPTRPTPSVYREAIAMLRAFNASLEQCQANFDARADNLLQFLDRIAGDIGSTSDILQARIESSNAGWFDPRADDRFWFAYGQLYAYYGVLTATRSDFSAIVADRNLTALWRRMEEQLRTALDMQPAIISNGNESSFLFPSHLATMGFHLLRVRSQLIEVRSVLDR
ncbi:MAG: hypothetical protein K0S21_517 [Rhizobiaceae bacterium]|jgi:hypothetical protein|nr:hypothetical protein [Rhizobiaceae bacterium]